MATRASRASIEITAQDKTGAAFSAVAGNLGNLQGQITGLAAGFAGVQATIGAVLGGLGIGALVNGVAQSLDAIGDLADATGASVSSVSRLDSAVRRAGGSFDDASALLLKFNQALGAADAGSDQARIFERLGLSVQALRDADPVDALLQTAQAFQKAGSSGATARAQFEILGKSVGTLSPVLKNLAESGAEFGAVTEEQAAAADAFVKALARVQAGTQDAARSAVSGLLPALTVTFDALNDAADGASAFATAGTALRTVFDTLVILGANVAFVFKGVGREIGAIAAQLAALARGDLDGFNAISRAVKEDAERARAELDRFERRLLSVGQAATTMGSENDARRGRGFVAAARIDFSPDPKPANAGKQPTATPEIQGPQIPESLQNALRLIAQTDTTKVAELRLQLQQLISIKAAGGGGPGIDEALLDVQDALDNLNPALQAAIDRDQALNDLLAATPTAKIEEATRQAQLLSEALVNATDPQEIQKLNEALDATVAKLQGVLPEAENIKKVDTLAEDLGLTFSSAFEDAIAGGKGLRDILAGIEQDIIRIITRKLVTEPFGNAITGLLGGGGGGGGLQGVVGSILKQIFPGSGGAPGFASLAGISGQRARGGPVAARQAYMVGENGPELLMMGSQGGAVYPDRGRGGSVQITLNQSFAPGTSRATTDQAAARAGAAVQRALQRNG
jgi:hypothetical protein